MKVFVTGVAGFLGSHIADRMLALGYKVEGCDNMIGGSYENIPKGVVFHQDDCCDLDSMKYVIDGSDVVYHCAATPYEGVSVFSPTIITKNIMQASVSVFTAAISCGVRRVVHCSSMARYGVGCPPFKEEDGTAPVDPYGIAKVASEMTLATLCGVHHMEYVVAVPHNIIGVRQRYWDPGRNVVSIMINLMLRGRQPIIYGDGTQMRCFSNVTDVVDAFEKLGFDESVVGEVFNVGPDNEFITINELANVIGDVIGMEVHPVYYPDRPTEVKLANCSSDKARVRLGYNPTRTLRETVVEMVDDIKKKGVREFEYNIPLEIISELTPRTWSERLF